MMMEFGILRTASPIWNTATDVAFFWQRVCKASYIFQYRRPVASAASANLKLFC